MLIHHPPTAGALGHAAATGILSSAVPFLADMLTLRRVPAPVFGVFMSVNPVMAALVGLVVLGQSLRAADWLAVAAIVTANTISVLTTARRTAAPAQSRATRRRTPRGPRSTWTSACGASVVIALITFGRLRRR